MASSILQRQADLGGLQWWAQQASDGLQEGKIVLCFLDTQEVKSVQHQNLADLKSTAEKVEMLYTALLGRPSDAAGKAWWIDAIENKGFSLNDAAAAFLHSVELTGQYLAPQDWDFIIS